MPQTVDTERRDSLRKVAAARRRREQAEKDIVTTIKIARASGATLQSIADAAGLTRQRVFQIVNERSH